MTREQLKEALRPHINHVPLLDTERHGKLVPIAKEWLAAELARGNEDHNDIFNTWNLVMVELLDELTAWKGKIQ